MKASELTAHHIGRQVEVNDPGHVKVAGMLTSVTHSAVFVDGRTLCDSRAVPVVAQVTTGLVIGGSFVDLADGDLATVEVSA